jgi:hypothetical protein
LFEHDWSNYARGFVQTQSSFVPRGSASSDLWAVSASARAEPLFFFGVKPPRPSPDAKADAAGIKEGKARYEALRR